MKIAFDFCGCGLGNNGGTRTIVKSAEVLSQLGHEVQIWNDDNYWFTWFPIPEGVEYIKGRNFPVVDVLVATGNATVKHVLASVGNGKGFYWVRGIETWNNKISDLVESYKSGLKILVNANWMKEWIKNKVGVESEIVYPGLETDFFVPSAEERDNVVGVLFSSKQRKRPDDIKRIVRRLKQQNVKVFALTTEKVPDGMGFDNVFFQPSEMEKRSMYQSIAVWLAVSDNEGLHVPPMEAGLCGCALVAHGKDSAGMGDYAIHDETALVYPPYNTDTASDMTLALISDNGKRDMLARNLRTLLLEKIGDRKSNMIRLVKILEGEQ